MEYIEDDHYELVENTLGREICDLLAAVEELPYLISMNATFGKRVDWDKFIKARNVVVGVLRDVADDLMAVDKEELMRCRLDHLESIVEKKE